LKRGRPDFDLHLSRMADIEEWQTPQEAEIAGQLIGVI
jgi:hypothetical protein